MGSASDTYENNFLDAVLGQGFTKDVTTYLALFTTAPTDSALGTEVSGGSYARVAVTNNGTNWSNATSSQKKNGVAITFPQASGSWGTVTHFAVMNHVSSSSATAMIAWGALTSSRTVSSGDTPQFAVDAIVISCD